MVLGSRSRPPTRIAAYACSIAQAANTVSQAVGVGVDVSEAPYIDGPLSRSVSSLICAPGLQCGDAGCPKCVCDCSC